MSMKKHASCFVSFAKRCWKTSVLPSASDRTGSIDLKEAVCVVFEKVNTGGKPLDAFELVTAMYAAKRPRAAQGLVWERNFKGAAQPIARDVAACSV